jgi:hypothetical protein
LRNGDAGLDSPDILDVVGQCDGIRVDVDQENFAVRRDCAGVDRATNPNLKDLGVLPWMSRVYAEGLDSVVTGYMLF